METPLLNLLSNRRDLFADFPDARGFSGPAGWDTLHKELTGHCLEGVRLLVGCVRATPRLIRHYPELRWIPPSTWEQPSAPSATGASLVAGPRGYVRMTLPWGLWPRQPEIRVQLPGPTDREVLVRVNAAARVVGARVTRTGALEVDWPPELPFSVRLLPPDGLLNLTPGGPGHEITLRPQVVPAWARWADRLRAIPEFPALQSTCSQETRHMLHNPDSNVAWIAALVRLLDETKTEVL